MALVTMVKGVVIGGYAYQQGQIADLTGGDLDMALARGYAVLYQPPTIVTEPAKPPIKPKTSRGKKQ